MRAENYWEQFLSTGKIDDYLAYRNTDLPKADTVTRRDAKTTALYQGRGRADGDEGVAKGAAAGQFYRDDFKG